MLSRLEKIYGEIPEPRFNNIVSTSGQYPSVFKTYKIESCDLLFPKDLDCIQNKYKYIRKLSDGSESTLYFVSDIGSHKRIIKKIPKYNHWREELFILNLIRKRNPTNLLKWIDFYENYKYAYIVTEYCGSYDLSQYVAINSPYSIKHTKKLARDMLLCIKECHDLNIVHLDIKCENFIVKDKPVLMNENSLVLIDFGHAELLNDKNCDEIISASFRYGTEDYVCPEGYNKKYSKKSDIWSFGICVFLLLTGNYIFEHPEYLKNIEMCTEKIENMFVKKSEYLSPTSISFIRACLKYNPEERPSVEDLLTHDFLQ